jgi:hypothetical protein
LSDSTRHAGLTGGNVFLMSNMLRRAALLPAFIPWHVRLITARVSLRVQLLATFLLLSAMTIGGTAFLFYNTMTAQAMTMLRNELTSSATALGAHLDATTVLRIHTNGRMNADYKAVEAQLQYMVATNPNIDGAEIFTRNPQDATTMLWIATSDVRSTCGNCNVTRLSYDPSAHATQMSDAFQHPTTSPSIYTDAYGSFLSGYAPIRDAKGTAVAIAEVDMSAQSVLNEQARIWDTGLRVVVIVLACLSAIVPLMAAIITSPLKTVTRAARALELGGSPDRQELLHAAQGSDEVSQLASVFGRMADEVQAREARLKRQVVELKIEIDLARQEAQVAEVTESDFFRELQQKAKRQRLRATDKPQIVAGIE